MKRLLTACFLLPALLLGSEIQVGDTLEATLEALGEPQGKIELRDKTLLLYPRGDVTLRDGIVSDVDLISEEALAEKDRRRAQERTEWQMDQERRIEARKAAGETEMAQRLSDPAFALRPARERVAYWRSFQQRYPEVDAQMQLRDALESYDSELAELRSLERLSELEVRVAQAEREAAAARLETERLRREARSVRYSSYGYRHVYPTSYVRPYYRPPTVIITNNCDTTRVPKVNKTPSTIVKKPLPCGTGYGYTNLNRSVPMRSTPNLAAKIRSDYERTRSLYW